MALEFDPSHWPEDAQPVVEFLPTSEWPFHGVALVVDICAAAGEEPSQRRTDPLRIVSLMSLYAPLNVRVATPHLELHGATDELLEALAPLVAAGKATADPPPWDDPSAFYEPDPDIRVQRWMQSVWRGRGTVRPDAWRLYFVVVVDGEPVGQQDITGNEFDAFGTVESTSWVSSGVRRRGIGSEMRSAILHLAFDGLGAAEAHSEGAVDNAGSNAVSERLGYERNGMAWATHQDKPVLGQRWRLNRETWQARRRDDITMSGVSDCRKALGIEPGAET